MAAEVEVQKALFLALTGIGLRAVDTGRQAADGGSDTPFPYVEVGTVVFAPWDTSRETGHDFVARIHTRSRAGGMMEAKGIQGQIYDRLHLGPLDVAGHRMVLLRRERSDVTKLDDGSFDGVCDYRGLIEKL